MDDQMTTCNICGGLTSLEQHEISTRGHVCRCEPKRTTEPKPATVKLEEELEEIRKRLGQAFGYEYLQMTRDLLRVLSMVDELMKDMEEFHRKDRQKTFEYNILVTEDHKLRTELRRKDEALEKIHDCEKYLKHPRDCLAWATDGDACDCGKDAIMCLSRDALAALADGKEGEE